ncbi:MAG: S8 family serine peptidase [Candidatus Cloacimonadaceae bacterium]|jgi:subtilisin family serine protease|nr:S8 family serine peptidase [Candidatus Cloacimonadota bacterium]MDX9948934.1 S8 family serine peptidase [Candidatus Syntrophosphaera sp.]
MKKLHLLVLLAFLVLTLALSAQNVTPKQVIVKSQWPLSIKSDRSGLTEFDSWLDRHGAFYLRPIKGMHQPRYYLVNLDEEPDWDTLHEGKLSFPGIEYVQPNYLSELHLHPNDPLYGSQFHEMVSNPQAWNYTTGSSQVIVGVIDSGCLINHPDLQANMYINPGEDPALGLHNNGIDDDGNGYIDDWCGWDFVDAPEMADVAVGDYLDQDNDVEDENFHGTHVAGIIGAVGNNAVGITGVCWNVKIMPIRAGFRTTTGQGYLQDDDAAAAIVYAADNGCHVINLSWGDPNYSPIIADACDYAYSKGVTIVASAGNDPGPILSYPAKLSNVISVGAVNRNRTLAGFSSYGPDLDIVAPGEMVLSTYKMNVGEQYFEQSGTSMSSPFVAGAAALLLSLHPGLSPDEVRSRLLTSTDDLGAAGFDMYYGHGLLNTRRLLENVNAPLIYVDEPFDHSGVTQSFDIMGTIVGDDFFRYSVMYSNKQVPSILDWFDVQTHQNYPFHYYQPVENDLLAHFHIPEAFPEGEYTIRLQYENTSGQKFNFFRSVIYDSSPPVLVQPSLSGFSRYDGPNLRFYVSAAFDELVRTELIIKDSAGFSHSVYGAVLDSIHVWAVPPHLPQGPVSIRIKATNPGNLSYLSPEFENFLNIQYEAVSNHGYSWTEIGQARVPLNYMYDYDGDGIKEYVAMDLPKTGYGEVFVYQPSPAGHILKHSFNESFWLLGGGDTNGLGQELLLLKGDTAILMDSQTISNYPNIELWEEPSITGGTIVDYSGDGIDDILLVKILPAERVIQAYKRSGNTFVPKNTLRNTSATDFYNTFVPTIIVRNFDGDNYKDILTADTDGDIMIFEIRNDNVDELVWSHRLPVGNTYSLAAGDFDGNGRQDFFVGGYHTDSVDPNRSFWYFEGFKSVSNNNYASMGSIMFNEVTSQSAILAHDLDGDGKDELILAIAPNLYILKYIDGKFKPVFYGQSYRNYSLLAYKDENNRPYFLTNYEVAPDSVVCVEWTTEDPHTGPPTPANFIAQSENESRVRLSWIDNGADSYRLYRRKGDSNPEILVEIPDQVWLDEGLEEGATYSYAVTAINSNYSPPESIPSVWQTVTPYPIPRVLEARMISSNMVKVMYDQRMSGDALNPSLYTVDHGVGQPSSVNSIATQCGVLLHFSPNLPPISEKFNLNIRDLNSAQGVGFSSLTVSFDWEEDLIPPKVQEVTVLDDKQTIRVLFSEEIAAINPRPQMLENYILNNHSNDPDNFIHSVVHEEDAILIRMGEKLKTGSAAYEIKIKNLRDLAGNIISAQGNIARFYLTNHDDLKHLLAYPNPVTSGSTQCNIINFPAGKEGQIRIYDSSGSLVKSAAIGPFDPVVNNLTWSWDLKNNEGKKVATGIYFYVVHMGKKTGRGKIAIIK